MIVKPVTQLPLPEKLEAIKELYLGLTHPKGAAQFLTNGASNGLESLFLFGSINEEYFVPIQAYRKMELDTVRAERSIFSGKDFFALSVQELTGHVLTKSIEDLAHYVALAMGMDTIARQVSAALPETKRVYVYLDSGIRPLPCRTRNGIQGRTIRTTGPGFLVYGTIFTDVNRFEKKEKREEGVAVSSRYL